jgi:hypothetical protein
MVLEMYKQKMRIELLKLKFYCKIQQLKMFTKATIHSKKAKSRNRIVGFQDQ